MMADLIWLVWNLWRWSEGCHFSCDAEAALQCCWHHTSGSMHRQLCMLCWQNDRKFCHFWDHSAPCQEWSRRWRTKIERAANWNRIKLELKTSVRFATYDIPYQLKGLTLNYDMILKRKALSKVKNFKPREMGLSIFFIRASRKHCWWSSSLSVFLVERPLSGSRNIWRISVGAAQQSRDNVVSTERYYLC